MKQDAEVLLMRGPKTRARNRRRRAGISVRTRREYERSGRLLGEMRQPRAHRTQPDPFAQDWPWVVAQWERDSALQATTLFALLCERHPGRY